MAPAKYEQRLRAERAEETRRRILDAVAHCLREAPTKPLSFDRIAERAKVARSTIYLVFGSRAGLFEAFTEDLWARTGLPALSEAVRNPDARQHLRGAVAAATRMFAADPEIYRMLFAMARLDARTVGAAVEKMNAERAGGLAHLARRLQEDGLLRSDVTVGRAVDVMWVLSSFETFDLLFTDRGLPVDDVVDVIVTTAEAAIVKPSA